ncbi:50S ribosomal protein L13 [Buchnera aphidicola (Mollitrichosiphum nigrofasciatum)]|uniref:50S ribosomal protein L13 n=1 Tax=Buchnera aphidicola TaxID=9 RepID=UPI0031B7EF18
MKTFSANDKIKKTWYYIDAHNIILGRLATKVATILRGKHKVIYTPNQDVGDYVIVINASKVKVTGNKYIQKKYYHHTGYIGGIKNISFKKLLSTYPERIIQFAVKGMLPKGSLGKSMFRKLKVYANNTHIHIAQKPKILKI